MTSTTRARVCGATGPVPSFSTRETTATDTPASRATSRIVDRLRTGTPYLVSSLLTAGPAIDLVTPRWYKTVTVTTLRLATRISGPIDRPLADLAATAPTDTKDDR